MYDIVRCVAHRASAAFTRTVRVLGSCAGPHMEYSGRTTRRHRVDLEALANWPAAPAPRACRLRDLSIGGAFVELGRLMLGTRIHLTFRLPILAAPLSLDAVVHWSTQQGVGVQFEAPRAWEVWVLWRYLEALAWGPLPDAAAEPLPSGPSTAPSPPTDVSSISASISASFGAAIDAAIDAVIADPEPAAEPIVLPDPVAWSRRRHVARTVLSVKASVADGRLRIDEAIDLPHGTRVAVVVFEDDSANGDLRARLVQIIDDASDAEMLKLAQAAAER